MIENWNWPVITRAIGYILIGAVIGLIVDRSTQGLLDVNRQLIATANERDLRGYAELVTRLDAIQLHQAKATLERKALSTEIKAVQQPIVRVIDVRDLAPTATPKPKPKPKPRPRVRRRKKP